MPDGQPLTAVKGLALSLEGEPLRSWWRLMMWSSGAGQLPIAEKPARSRSNSKRESYSH